MSSNNLNLQVRETNGSTVDPYRTKNIEAVLPHLTKCLFIVNVEADEEAPSRPDFKEGLT